MRKRSNIALHGVVHAKMHINKNNPNQNFKSKSGLPCMLSETSIRHLNVMNVLYMLSPTDYIVFVDNMLFISMNNSLESWDLQDHVLGRGSPCK